MKQSGELVDFERGSTFGGIVTTIVFVGFIYFILSDLSDNINNLPYTFEVKSKYLSPEEHRNTVVNFGENEQSVEFFLGFIAYAENGDRLFDFDPLDNDYIEVLTGYWDTGKNTDEGKPYLFVREGPEVELCS